MPGDQAIRREVVTGTCCDPVTAMPSDSKKSVHGGTSSSWLELRSGVYEVHLEDSAAAFLRQTVDRRPACGLRHQKRQVQRRRGHRDSR
ncbi:hypothetical protein G6F63_014751 [Rhizopus arrhizus]|nr:hypothetical protein G6F63_014751 [Rhizopus arrhizus]